MGMTATNDASQEFSLDYRRGSSRKPPRPRSRRRRCVSEDVMRNSASGRLTTFQKLDREMGRFVKSLQNGKANQQLEKNSCGTHVSEAESGSFRGVHRGVKWKCGWMFEQDSLYWETVRRQNVSPGDYPWCSAHTRDTSSSTCDSSSSSCENLDEDALRHHCSTDCESVSSGREVNLMSSRRDRRGLEQKAQAKDNAEGEKRRADSGWPAILKAKCKVLQLEKELADQRLRQQSADMAQAAKMAHCLRSSVQTVLETAKRGTVSAPCTPGRNHPGDYPSCLQQRIQPLHAGNVQRDLENQARSFQSRIDSLRLQSQIRSGDTSISKTRLSSTSSTTQLTSDGEDWAQVQEVMKQLRGKTGSLQYSCENWEKRAIFAESKAASLQIEEEKWRVASQKSEEKARELEMELVQVRATLEEVRHRHALEQSRLLGSGSGHGYTLVLQPIVTGHGSCKGVTDCGLCSHCHMSSPSGFTQPPAVPDVDNTPELTAAVENCREIQLDVPVSDRAPSPTQVHSPDREPTAAATTTGQASSRHRYEGAQGDDDSQTPTKAEPVSITPVQETTKTKETEKSLSQKWFKQRPKSRRPGTPSCEMSTSETRSTLGNSPIPPNKVMQRKGAQKPGPVYAGSLRVSSPSNLENRVPLQEIKRNAACANGDVKTKSEFS